MILCLQFTFKIKKRMDRNQMEKKKGTINCAVQVVTRIFNLSILNLVKTWNKAKTEETNYLLNKFHLEWQYIDWALFCLFAYRIYTRTVRLLYLLTLLFKSTNYKTFSAFFYITFLKKMITALQQSLPCSYEIILLFR